MAKKFIVKDIVNSIYKLVDIFSTDIQDFQFAVSNNSDVSSNTSHRNTTSGNPHHVTLAEVGGTKDHNGLDNLQGGSSGEYYHLTEQQHTNVVIKKTGISIDGGGNEITAGEHGFIYIPYSGTIKSVVLLSDQTGSIKIDIWKSDYDNYPPTDANSICGGNEPEISSGIKYKDTTLNGWNTAINSGDILKFNVDSCSTITKVTLVLEIEV